MKAQFSFELLLVLAAYFALLSVFAVAEKGFGERAREEAGLAAARIEANAACFLLDSFSVNARNTAMEFERAPQNYSGSGRKLVFKSSESVSGSALCLNKLRSTDVFGVSQSKKEPA